MGQNTSNSVWKPCEDLQKTFDLCHCQQRVYNKVLRWNFVIDQILIFHHNLQINSLKILQCDFLDFFFFSYIVSHSWGIPMMKITGLSHLFKWENLPNWWLTKYFFAPLYVWTFECGTFGEKKSLANVTVWISFWKVWTLQTTARNPLSPVYTSRVASEIFSHIHPSSAQSHSVRPRSREVWVHNVFIFLQYLTLLCLIYTLWRYL